MTQDTTYNGWSNRETWNVNLWLANTEDLYRVVEASKNLYNESLFAGWLETFVRSNTNNDGGFGDLTAEELDSVNWTEIATAWVEA